MQVERRCETCDSHGKVPGIECTKKTSLPEDNVCCEWHEGRNMVNLLYRIRKIEQEIKPESW